MPKSGQACIVYRRKVAQNEKVVKDMPKELKDLQGRWSIVSQEVGGEKEPPLELPKGFTLCVVIKGNVFSYEVAGVAMPFDDEEGTITINAKSDPKEIDLDWVNEVTKKAEKGRGIYRLEGDNLKICFAGNDEKDRPSAFATKAGTKQSLMTLKRQK